MFGTCGQLTAQRFINQAPLDDSVLELNAILGLSAVNNVGETFPGNC